MDDDSDINHSPIDMVEYFQASLSLIQFSERVFVEEILATTAPIPDGLPATRPLPVLTRKLDLLKQVVISTYGR